jgi:hypothetical protein
MYLLGTLTVWLLVLGFAGLPVALLGLWVWWLWQGVQRRRPRPPRSPYDDAYVRALEEVARSNGRRAAERDLRELEA